MSWPNLEDTSGISKSIFGPGVPVTWFIDENGKNIETKIGAYANKKQLFNQVEKAFGVKL
jgi:cytochrome c biogenesis protein CcmG/thiol:disulfide interchange protein DsbE